MSVANFSVDKSVQERRSKFNSLAIFLIRLYQRYISPYKGYQCVHNYVHKQGSCSAFGIKCFESENIFTSISLILKRFQECKATAIELREDRILDHLHQFSLQEAFGNYEKSNTELGCLAVSAACPLGGCFYGCVEVIELKNNPPKKKL